ncbi:MAG: hypothetical protein RLZZ197_1951 [Bacteroidota bacterium]
MKKILFLLMMPLLALAGPKETVKIKTSAICEMCKERMVEYDAAKIDAAGIRKAISETGYDADDVKAIAKDYAKLPNCCKKKD